MQFQVTEIESEITIIFLILGFIVLFLIGVTEIESEIAVIFLTLGFIVLVLIGCAFLTDYQNVGVEARCIELGGQVIRNPGHLSSCILPRH